MEGILFFPKESDAPPSSHSSLSYSRHSKICDPKNTYAIIEFELLLYTISTLGIAKCVIAWDSYRFAQQFVNG